MASQSSGNPWFASTMFLGGLIVGYVASASLGGLASARLVGNTIPNQPTQQQPTPSAPTPPPLAAVPEVTDEDHVRGSDNPDVYVIEYSDFECPFCKRHHPTMEQVVEEYDNVAWVYRHFPLSFHPNAMPAAVASECAGDQGKFWEMADALIETDTYDYEAIAAEIGLNVATFTACLEDNEYEQYVQDQADGGAGAGVSGTPGNFVVKAGDWENAVEISGAVPFGTFKAAIDKMLAE